MTTFVQGKMQKRSKDGFSILLPVAGVVQMFGNKLKLFCIMVVPQVNHHPRLILNLSEKLDVSTPSVNGTTNREAALESLQFRRAFPRILKVV